MGLRIKLLGRPVVTGGAGDERTIRGQQSWAVLARILLSDRPLSRQTIATELFADADDPLGALRWCLTSIRRVIGREALAGDPIRLNLPTGTTVDVWDVEEGEIDIEQGGHLLEGIEPKASPEFATWLLVERERMATRIDERIRQETLVALSAGEYSRAVRLAETGVHRRPFDEPAHVLLAKSLVLDGRHEAALKHVEATEKAFLSELGEKPSPALRSAARATIASPLHGVSSRAIVESLINSGVAAVSAGAVDAGIDCLRRAAADAESAGDTYLRARSLFELGSALVHAVRGYDDEGAILLRQAAELARRCGARDIASTSLRELGYVESLAGRRPAAAQLLEAALESNGDDRDGLAGIHATMAVNLVDWGRIDEGLAHYEESLDHARSTGNRRWEIWSLGLGGWGWLAANQPEIASQWLESSLTACDEVRWLSFRPWPLAVLAEARLRLQDNPESLRSQLEDAFALSRQLGDPCWEAASARSMALTYIATDEYESAMRWLVEARRLCLRVTDTYLALFVEILADQVKLSRKVEQPEQTSVLGRELISAAARTHADAHLRQAMTLVNEVLGEPGASKAVKS